MARRERSILVMSCSGYQFCLERIGFLRERRDVSRYWEMHPTMSLLKSAEVRIEEHGRETREE
jgi:hypothetical protein